MITYYARLAWYTASMDTLITFPTWFWFVIIPLAIWTIFWKSLALWHAARRGSVIWFMLLMLVNTAGILEIIFLIVAGKLNASQLFTSGQPSQSRDQP